MVVNIVNHFCQIVLLFVKYLFSLETMLKFLTVKTNKHQQTIPGASSSNAGMKRDTPSSSSEPSPSNVKKAKSGKHKVVKHREHVLLRPDTYVGPTEQHPQHMWVITRDGTPKEREVTYSAALLKIFDEILQNIADFKQLIGGVRNVHINVAPDGTITIRNDGQGISTADSDHKDPSGNVLSIPEMIFGVLLSGSNYNDDEDRLGGGRNGYGAKLANIFSIRFTVETVYVDSEAGSAQSLEVTWWDNMSKKGKAKRTKKGSKKGYTKITFLPDYKRFGYGGQATSSVDDRGRTSYTGWEVDGRPIFERDDDVVDLFRKRAYDIAGTTPNNLKVHFSTALVFERRGDDRIRTVDNFHQYCKLFAGDRPLYYSRIHDRLEVGIFPRNGEDDNSIDHVSFVNSVNTFSGGTHVKLLYRQINKFFAIEKRGAWMQKYYMLMINCTVVNPTFGSQIKDTLTTRENDFEGRNASTKKYPFLLADFGRTFNTSTARAAIRENMHRYMSAKQEKQKSTIGGRKTTRVNIPKLEDANFAGHRSKAAHCTLILTEGDSAKSLAMSGLSVVGRDKYGVFPLKGKLLNVREANHTQFMNNAEIQNIMGIMGLRPGKEYSDNRGLRYGKIMIMADQDHDGFHIKGLIINFIHKYWPSLLEKVRGFIQVFITPIMVAKKKRGGEKVPFYSMGEYDAWREAATLSSWSIKYYKGLGTSTPAEGKEYFRNLSRNRKELVYVKTRDSDLIDMCFNKMRVEERKAWINGYDGEFMDYTPTYLTVESFVKKELVTFAIADNERSLPSLFDGFKTSQRKVTFACIKRNLTKELRVAQLAGYTSEHAAYHHGEASLNGTIVGMAQNHLGTNNVNLLVPAGSYGDRLGGVAAQPRYIHTHLSPWTRKIFHPDDDALLNYLDDDGMSIEPEYYMPILPMLLVNGCSGIGTGWSTSVPKFNPQDIIVKLRQLLRQEPYGDQLVPWVRGFCGRVEGPIKTTNTTSHTTVSYRIFGKATWESTNTLHISEIPYTTKYDTYKTLVHAETFKDKILDIREAHKNDHVSFKLTLSDDFAAKMKENDPKHDRPHLWRVFRLVSSESVNMTCFNAEGKICKYESTEDIVRVFFDARMGFYRRRKQHLVDVLSKEMVVVANKKRFIDDVLADALILKNKSTRDISAELETKGYSKIAGDYQYLLSMRFSSLSTEEVERLGKRYTDKKAELDATRQMTETEMWQTDLCALEESLGNL